MRRRFQPKKPVLMIVAALMVTSGSAGATTGTTFRAERTYLHCADASIRLHNAAGALGGLPISWDTKPPSAAFLGNGAGCAFASGPDYADGPWIAGVEVMIDAKLEGTFRGNLRALTVDLHDLSRRADAGSDEQQLYVTLTVDGQDIVTNAPVITTSVPENSGATHSVRFSIVNLPFALQEGTGDIQHTVRLRIASQQGNVWAYDAAEVPAGIHFNPASVEAARISV